MTKREFQLFDKVRILHEGLKPHLVGVVEEVRWTKAVTVRGLDVEHGRKLSFLVHFPDGDRFWFRASELEHANES